MKHTKSIIRIPLLVVMLWTGAACTTLDATDDPAQQTSSDPFVGINHKVYAFNNAADKVILQPAARAYKTVLPNQAQHSVRRFFSNLNEPLNIVNNLLQGKVDGALNSTYRFAVNSTVGVLGLFDIAKLYGVDKRYEDLGQTLAVWGVKPGPYVMVPFWGPSTIRDGLGLVFESAAYYPINEISDSNSAQSSLTLLNIIDNRAGLLDTSTILDNQLDPYTFLKDAYDQNRLNAVYDGKPPEPRDDQIDFDF